MAKAANILRALGALRQCRRGAASMEYGLIAALIAMAAIGSLNILGDNLSAKFDQLNRAMDDAPIAERAPPP
ncbi:MAG: Flp family type IVb pilin [Hyphomicrobiales bacterium]|nr:Flp family type IVb pilin [Rhodoblastus sp.]MCC2112881.1 Flp family type IVb pilin [Hyphomicrobiales bacterium]